MPRQFKVTVNGREYDVSVLELTAGQPAPSAGAAAGDGDILAGMGGTVVEVLVKVGQTVAAGDRLMVLEAMKMKTPVMATRAGQVTRVLVAAGDPIEGGQPLLTIA